MTTSKKSENEDKDSKEKVDFNDLLVSAGGLGRYQLLLALANFPFYLSGVFSNFAQLFVTEVSPNHWCWIPELANLSAVERRNLATPPDANTRFGYSYCETYLANWTDVLINNIKPNSSWDRTSCKYGWEFNTTEIPYPTVSSEYEWVCDKDSYQATAQSIFFLGSIFGVLITGWIGDRYGRLLAISISNLLGCIGSIASAFTTNFVSFCICRFINGMAFDNCRMLVFIILLEYTLPKYRNLVANASFSTFYTISIISLPWIALACGHWKIIFLVTSAPMAFAVLAPLFIPESPSWLLSKGRVNEAISKIVSIGRVNKMEIPNDLIEKFKLSEKCNQEEESKSALELFRRPLIRRMFIFMCLEQVCCACVFEILLRTIDLLDFNFFISFSIISITEFPSVFVLAFITDLLGKRWLTSITMIVTAISCFLTKFVNGWQSVMFAWIARFGINMAYTVALQWTAETLPISVRGSGVAIVHTCAYFAMIVSPYIVYLKIYYSWIPLVVGGVLSLICAIIVFALPETLNREMPQTFEDAENLILTQKFWDIPCMSKKPKDVVGNANNGFEM